MTDPYGGFDLVATIGAGGIVSSAAPLLIFLEQYLAEWDTFWFHGGVDGTSTTIGRIKSNGINIVVLFSERTVDTLGHAGVVAEQILSIINESNLTWPTFCVDGFWLDFNASSSGFGGHDDPFHTMDAALAAIADGTKLRIKEGTSNWTGTISTRTLIDAPFGRVVIGQ